MWKNLIKIFLLFYGLTVYAGGAGTTAFNFLKIDTGSRGVSMGGAYTSIADEPCGIFYNPAGILNIENIEIALMHLEYFEDIRYDIIAGGFTVSEDIVLGGSLGLLYILDIPRTIRGENPAGFLETGSFNYYDFSGIFTFAYQTSDYSSVGINLKYLREKIDEVTGSTFAVDLGYFRYIPGLADINIGLAVKNLALPVKFLEKSEPLPVILSGGVSVSFLQTGINSKEYRDLLISLDIEKPVDSEFKIKSGLEFRIFDIGFIRGGYSLTVDNSHTGVISGGAGIVYKRFKFDYALRNYRYLGFTHTITVGVMF